MSELTAVDRSAGYDKIDPISCHELLRTATQAPHERLHGHAGFARVKDGAITIPDYRALLVCLYGFYRPFECAIGVEPVRTQWLESDLVELGINTASLPDLRQCQDIPRYECSERVLGALYVVEGSALGGRQLYRGLDHLFGREARDGRHFFAGRGAGTGAAWLGYLGRLAAIGPEQGSRDKVVIAAVETFAVFENWLSGWDKTA